MASAGEVSGKLACCVVTGGNTSSGGGEVFPSLRVASLLAPGREMYYGPCPHQLARTRIYRLTDLYTHLHKPLREQPSCEPAVGVSALEDEPAAVVVDEHGQGPAFGHILAKDEDTLSLVEA